ncbi:MAG: radical SAM family heme chaperone HemW [Chitinophagaceae bacterium]|nr:radical SAM family heme chaperone HemW [Chitinophagaceae bacterium]
MAGIYIHIPFCRQACHYCDFHFSVKQEYKTATVAAIVKEMELQQHYLGNELIHTIYLGGGTPSLLNQYELNSIFEKLYQRFDIDSNAEITLEANPDDLTIEKIAELAQLPVNRLSIGIQSFDDADLKWMNRAHNAKQATHSVQAAQDAGFDNISIDLMYGLPESNEEMWEQNISKALELNVNHISCYCLTVEPKTALAHFILSGKSKPINEEQSARQFEVLMKKMKEQDWKHYEISNFSSDDLHCSKHNTAYWQGKKYLGLGPSAHSFNGVSRQWNVSNNHQYMETINNGKTGFEKEILTPTQQINERIMTQLRTMWGLKLTDFAAPAADLIRDSSREFITAGFASLENNALILTDSGKLIADKIIVDLMLEED